MEAQYALVCDWANSTETGKLNVMGEFDIIWAEVFPAVHLTMFFCAKVLLSAGDPDEVAFELRVVGEDGQLATNPVGIRGRRNAPPTDGELATLRLVIQVNAAQFREPGTYSFELHAGPTRLASADLHVKQLVKPNPPAPS